MWRRGSALYLDLRPRADRGAHRALPTGRSSRRQTESGRIADSTPHRSRAQGRIVHRRGGSRPSMVPVASSRRGCAAARAGRRAVRRRDHRCRASRAARPAVIDDPASGTPRPRPPRHRGVAAAPARWRRGRHRPRRIDARHGVRGARTRTAAGNPSSYPLLPPCDPGRWCRPRSEAALPEGTTAGHALCPCAVTALRRPMPLWVVDCLSASRSASLRRRRSASGATPQSP